MTALNIQLNQSAISVQVKQNIKVQSLYLRSGLSSLLCTFIGSPIPGVPWILTTVFGMRTDKGNKVFSLIFAIYLFIIYVVPVPLISYFPKEVIVGLIVYVSLTYVYQYFVKERKGVTLIEYFGIFAGSIIIYYEGFRILFFF